MKMNKAVIKKMLKYLNKNIISLVITFVLAIASVMLTIYVPILFGNAIDLIVDKDNVNFDGLNVILFKISNRTIKYLYYKHGTNFIMHSFFRTIFTFWHIFIFSSFYSFSFVYRLTTNIIIIAGLNLQNNL